MAGGEGWAVIATAWACGADATVHGQFAAQVVDGGEPAASFGTLGHRRAVVLRAMTEPPVAVVAMVTGFVDLRRLATATAMRATCPARRGRGAATRASSAQCPNSGSANRM